MMRHPKEIAETAMSLLREVATLICAHPQMLEMRLVDLESYVIETTAHPSDSRRLVGKDGVHFRALTSLARLLFHGSGRLVTFMPVTSPDVAETPWAKMKPDPNWPKDRVVALVKGLASAVFTEAHIEVELVPHNDWSSKIIVRILEDRQDNVERRFSAALHTLFTPIGSNIGHMLYVAVDSGRNHVDAGTDSAAGPKGPGRTVGVFGAKPLGAGGGAPGGHDGL